MPRYKKSKRSKKSRTSKKSKSRKSKSRRSRAKAAITGGSSLISEIRNKKRGGFVDELEDKSTGWGLPNFMTRNVNPVLRPGELAPHNQLVDLLTAFENNFKDILWVAGGKGMLGEWKTSEGKELDYPYSMYKNKDETFKISTDNLQSIAELISINELKYLENIFERYTDAALLNLWLVCFNTLLFEYSNLSSRDGTISPVVIRELNNLESAPETVKSFISSLEPYNTMIKIFKGLTNLVNKKFDSTNLNILQSKKEGFKVVQTIPGNKKIEICFWTKDKKTSLQNNNDAFYNNKFYNMLILLTYSNLRDKSRGDVYIIENDGGLVSKVAQLVYAKYLELYGIKDQCQILNLYDDVNTVAPKQDNYLPDGRFDTQLNGNSYYNPIISYTANEPNSGYIDEGDGFDVKVKNDLQYRRPETQQNAGINGVPSEPLFNTNGDVNPDYNDDDLRDLMKGVDFTSTD